MRVGRFLQPFLHFSSIFLGVLGKNYFLGIWRGRNKVANDRASAKFQNTLVFVVDFGPKFVKASQSEIVIYFSAALYLEVGIQVNVRVKLSVMIRSKPQEIQEEIEKHSC